MSFTLRIIEDFYSEFFHSSSTFQTDEEDTNYSFIAGLGVILISSACLARGYWKKREYQQLTLQECMGDPRRFTTLQRAAYGTCKVYLGQDFVAKQCGDQYHFRAARAGLARLVIQNNHYMHLVVPKFLRVIGGEYLVEERLSVCLTGEDAETLYQTYRNAFTPAVKEFAHMLMRCTFTDIVTFRDGSYDYLTPVPRYDNICPYLENGEGKLGLVDLEHFEEGSVFPITNEGFRVEVEHCNLQTCTTLIHLFPLHFSEIIEVMQTAGLKLNPQDLKTLETSRDNQIAQRKSKSVLMVYRPS